MPPVGAEEGDTLFIIGLIVELFVEIVVVVVGILTPVPKPLLNALEIEGGTT